jgi:hydrogenase expression/formation protein HypC
MLPNGPIIPEYVNPGAHSDRNDPLQGSFVQYGQPFLTSGQNKRRGREVMCIAMPGEVLEIKEGNIGVVDFGDLQQEVRLDLVDVKVGEFVLVHVGFAIQRLSREDGLETREVFKQVYAAMTEE